MNQTPVQSRLQALLVERSVRLGSFTLASGATADYYVDARRTTMCAEGQNLVGQVGFELIRRQGWNPSHIGGLTLGSDPIAYAIAGHSWRLSDPVDAFTVRKSAKDHGTGQRIEGGLPQGASVVVIEDSITSGGSTLEAIGVLEDHGCTILGVCSLVDRREGAAERLAEAGYDLASAFTGPDLLVAARTAAESSGPASASSD